ncbi:MAG: mechanosensitive ion channel [Legionellales bacterium]|nr:mechanosensitive ion channel [Legionellales bacterium]
MNYIENLFARLDIFLPKVAISIFILAIFLVFAYLGEKIIFRLSMRNTAQNIYIYQLLGKIFRIIMVIIGLISSLGTLGIHVGAMIGGLGLTGFAIGFAIKDIISNILAGILILLYRPIKLGNQIEVSGFSGNISGIDLRYTSLDTKDKTILIPNSKVFSSIVCIDKES